MTSLESIDTLARVYVQAAATPSEALRLPRGEGRVVDGINIYAALRVGPLVSSPDYTVGRVVTTHPCDAKGRYWSFDVSVAEHDALPEGETVGGQWRFDKASHTVVLVRRLDRDRYFVSLMLKRNPPWFAQTFSAELRDKLERFLTEPSGNKP